MEFFKGCCLRVSALVLAVRAVPPLAIDTIPREEINLLNREGTE